MRQFLMEKVRHQLRLSINSLQSNIFFLKRGLPLLIDNITKDLYMDDQEINKRYLELAEKWMNGTITAEEANEYADWYNSLPVSEVNIPPSFASSEEVLHHRMLAAIREKNKGTEGDVYPLRTSKIGWLKYAAAIILLIGSAAFIYFNWGGHSKMQESGATVAQQEILPGGHKATFNTCRWLADCIR